MRIAEHALGDEGRVERRDVGARRHERREQLRVVAAAGDDEGRVAVVGARVGVGLGVEEGEGGGGAAVLGGRKERRAAMLRRSLGVDRRVGEEEADGRLLVAHRGHE